MSSAIASDQHPEENEKALPNMSKSGVNSLLVAPLGFRQNAHFVGFDIEMARLNKKVSESRGGYGTRTVLLYGPPGCGKSHLARQYVCQHFQDYPNGVFWIDCKTMEALRKGFWNISQTLQCHDDIEKESKPDEFVDAVRRHLAKKDKWLIVFDGIKFDTEQQLHDFVRFIPAGKDAVIIYTSVDKTLSRRQRLLDPPGIKIYPLTTEQGCSLLFDCLRIKRPSALQLQKAKQLVKHVDALPLGIHAAAHSLMARGRALEKFQPGPSDNRLSSPFLSILVSMQQHQLTEALNMLFLLCFLANEVPVVMLRYGGPALQDAGVEIKSIYAYGSERNEINNTISTLIKYGLLERKLSFRSSSDKDNEPAEIFHSPLIQQGPHLPQQQVQADNEEPKDTGGSYSTANGIDTIIMHSVAQQVYLDHLKSQSEARFDQWLVIATKFIMQAWSVTRTRIQTMSDPIMHTSDFREVGTHAEKIWSFFPRRAVGASSELVKARHDLHQLRRQIKQTIEEQPPLPPLYAKRMLTSTVFHYDSEDEEEEDEDDDDVRMAPTRKSAWNTEIDASDPPIAHTNQAQILSFPQDNLREDAGYSSEDNLRAPVEKLASTRDAALHAIFGRSRSEAERERFKETPVTDTVPPTAYGALNDTTEPTTKPSQPSSSAQNVGKSPKGFDMEDRSEAVSHAEDRIKYNEEFVSRLQNALQGQSSNSSKQDPRKVDIHSDILAFTDSGYETMQRPILSIAGHKLSRQDDALESESLDDNVTNYSVDSVDTPRDDLVEDFSQQLFADLQATNLTQDEYEDRFFDMEEVFLDFALRLGHCGSSADLLKAQKFVHEYRNALSQSFRRNFLRDIVPAPEEELEKRSDSSESQPDHRPSGTAMSINAKMEMWESKMSPEATYEAEEVDENHDPLNELKHTVFTSIAYTWLLKSLSSRSSLINNHPKILLAVQSELRNAVPRPRRISRRTAVPASCIVYETDWSLTAFLDAQWPTWHDTGWLGDIVTLTGASVDAQAISCEAYLKQNWPLIGTDVLRLVDTNLRTKKSAHCKLFDGTQVEAFCAEKDLNFHVEGVRGSVIEVGEQLCWLMCALSMPTKLGLVVPVLEPQSQLVGRLPSRLKISSRSEAFEVDDTEGGTCWHNLFGSAGVVGGFPILKRSRSRLGLEIPLKVAAALIGARYITRHDNVDSLRSSAACMTAREQLDDTIIWHLDIAHKKTSSAFLKDVEESFQTDRSIINFERHIIGWSEQAKHHFGGADCNYEIGASRTRLVDPNCALHTSVLSPAIPIPRDQPFQILKDQYPPYHVPHELPIIMRRLGARFVCFWDIDEQRAWLTDGVAALAHVVRGSIASDRSQTPEFMQLDKNSLHEPVEPERSNAPSLFLCHVSNQQMPILSYPHKGEMRNENFEDRVVQSYHLLDSAFAYQEKFKNEIKKSARTILEGWDFHDLTWRRDDPHNARFTNLGSEANGWVNLLREIGAITILGRGFGELIEPISVPPRPLCSKWTTLPTGHCYMAASHTVLRKIALHHGGSISASPVKLTNKTSLIVPASTFDCCGCHEGESRSEPVQIFWPTKKLNLLDYAHKMSAFLSAEGDGTSVFGHNNAHEWHWPDHGGPERGPPPAASLEDDSDSDSSAELSTFDGATGSLPSQRFMSPNTSVSLPNRSISQSSQNHRNAYGPTKVDGEGRLIMGNVYITNNNTTAAPSVDHGYPAPDARRNATAMSPPDIVIQGEYQRRLLSPPIFRSTPGTILVSSDGNASDDPDDVVQPELTEENGANQSRWTNSRIGFEVARAFSQPWLEPDNKRE